MDKFGKNYVEYTFVRTSLNNAKNKVTENNVTVTEKRMAAGVICQRLVVATGTGVVKANFW